MTTLGSFSIYLPVFIRLTQTTPLYSLLFCFTLPIRQVCSSLPTISYVPWGYTASPSGEYAGIRPISVNCNFIYYSTCDGVDAKHLKAASRTISNYLHALRLKSARIYLTAQGCARKKIPIILTTLATHLMPNKAGATRPENCSPTYTDDQTHATNNTQQNPEENLHVPLTTNTPSNGSLENADTPDH
jgi:hypothetical protein